MKGPSLPPLDDCELVQTSFQWLPVRSGLGTLPASASRAVIALFNSTRCSTFLPSGCEGQHPEACSANAFVIVIMTLCLPVQAIFGAS